MFKQLLNMLKTFGIKVFKTFEKINVKNLKKKKKTQFSFLV